MTKRELEIQIYNQRVATQQAEQRALDAEYALDLLLNRRFKGFHKTVTSDGAVQEFLMGIVEGTFITDPMRRLFKRSQTEDRQIVFWKTTWESGEQHASAFHNQNFDCYRKRLTIYLQN